jgi:hypothetical protein
VVIFRITCFSLFLLNTGLEYGHVSGQLVTTDLSIGPISNITQSKNYTPQLTVVPSQLPNLLSSHNTMIPVSTGNTSLGDTTQTEGLSKMNCMCCMPLHFDQCEVSIVINFFLKQSSLEYTMTSLFSRFSF